MEENFPPRKRKTENRSFRISSEVLEGLEDEAERKKVSVNTLVNQLLADYINVRRHRLRLGSLSMSVTAFKLIIAATSDQDIIGAGATAGRSVPRAYASSKWGEESAKNVMSFIKENASVTGLYDYSESPNTPGAITLTHPFGRKWSLYLASFCEAAFEDAGEKVRSEVSDQAVVLKLP
ncbi:MAG: hypothetical protein ABSG45_06340 [Nitrososphaerales archaeon]|jgi:hypothetical protein